MPKVYSKNECFPMYLLKNPHECVLKPSEQCSFLQDGRFEGVSCLGLP